MDKTTVADVLARITISAYGLDGAELQDCKNGMVLILDNGQRFTLKVTETTR